MKTISLILKYISSARSKRVTNNFATISRKMGQDDLFRETCSGRGDGKKFQELVLIPRRVSHWRDAPRRAASFFTESAGKCKCAGHLATMAVVCGPYFKGWFFGRGREGGSARVAARGSGREGWRALPAMQSSQKYSSSSSGGNPHDRPRLYTGSPNPLIRVDSHDRLEGYPPTNLPLLIHPLPFEATHNSPILNGVLVEKLLARTLIRNMPD